MQAHLVPATSDAWNDVVRTIPHDVYHLAEYAQLCSGMEGGLAQAFVATENRCRLFVPLIVRRLPAGLSGGEGLHDATVPYGYPGPIVSCNGSQPDGTDGFVHRALGALVTR